MRGKSHRPDRHGKAEPAALAPVLEKYADLLTVTSLLVGALDPTIVGRAAQVVGGGLADALAQLLPLAPMIGAELAGTPGVAAAPGMRGAVSPAGCLYEHPSPGISLGEPYGGVFAIPCGGPFSGALGRVFGAPIAGPHVPRALAPPWHWPHSLFAY